MKISNFLTIAFAFVLLAAIACNNKKEDTTTQEPGMENMSAQEPGAALATGASSEKHYVCPKNCEGSGGDGKGTCPVCGSEYVHNQAFHAQSPTAAGTPENPIQIDPNAGAVTQTPPNPAATVDPPAAQNAKGEWHFACSKSCGGGAGAQGTCPKCGAELAHNSAYHQ
jgi:hypothetical protein